MTDIAAALSKIHAADFGLEVDGDNLAVSPFSRLTDDQQTFIRQYKPEIIQALRAKTLDAGQAGSDIAPANHAPILVQVWTPAGDMLTVEAKDEAHAEWLQKVNPPPRPDAVMCQNCQNAEATTHPALVKCGSGVDPGNPTQAWWKTDKHPCNEFKENTYV